MDLPKKLLEDTAKRNQASKKTDEILRAGTSFDVTDGKDRDAAASEATQTLEELLGIGDISPFKTNSLSVFKAKLGNMSLAAKQELATRVGVPPTNRERKLVQTLLDAFKSYAQSHGTPIPSMPKPCIDPNSPEAKEIVKIWDE